MPTDSSITDHQEYDFKHILLVDDDPNIIKILEFIISGLGYKYTSASDGLEAKNYLHQDDFDLVITDIEMPGMNGVELVRYLRENFPDTDSIVVTGLDERYSFTDAIKAGATDYLSKPFSREELSVKLNRIRRERSINMAYRHEIRTNKLINDLLHICLSDIDLETTFKQFIGHLTSMSWLNLETKGAVFLANNTHGSLKMMAQQNLNEALLKSCAQVPFGTCLCGRAAKNLELVFTDHLDERHETHYEGICNHGHYCVPIKTGAGDLLGVLTLYVRNGTKRIKHVEETLLAVSQTAAVLIQFHQAKAKIIDDEKRFQLVMESSPDGIMFIDQSGEILLANRQIEKLFGYKREELLGEMVEVLVPKRYVAKHPHKRNIFFTKQTNGPMNNGHDTWGLRKDGSEFALEAGLSYVQTAHGNYAVCSIRDVSEKRRIQTEIKNHRDHLEKLVDERSLELHESEAQLRAITSSARVAIIMIDHEGIISFWNEEAERCFSWSSTEALGKNVHDLIIPLTSRAAHIKAYKKFSQTGKGDNLGKVIELEGLRRDGSEFPLEMALSAVKIKKNWHAIAIIADITTRKKVENELQQKMADMEKFNRLALDRELNMIDLKMEINTLLLEDGKAPRYKIVP